MNTNEKRDFINFLRGLAIFLMLWGHCIQYCCGNQFNFFQNTLYKIIYSFHMPLFMLISGYLFYFSAKNRNCSELINYKVKSLLYPILMCSLLNHLITECVFSLRTGRFLDIFGTVQIKDFWFLWSVLAASFAVAIAVKITNNRIIQALLFFLGIIIVALFPFWQKNVFMYPYFVTGYLFGRNEERLNTKFNICGIISLIAFIIMLFFYEEKHYIYTVGLISNTLYETITIDIFRWAIGIFGSIAVIYIFKSIKVFKSNNTIVEGIEFLGSNSLAIYLVSCALLSFWLPLISNRVLNLFPKIDWNKCIIFYNFVITPLIAVFYSVFLSLIIILMKKLKLYKIIFGR